MIVALFGSGDNSHTSDCQLARRAGQVIAQTGHDLLTGGGGGAMQEALAGFATVSALRGKTFAVLPDKYPAPLGRYDIVIATGLPAPKTIDWDQRSRNFVNAKLCDAAIAVSITAGTTVEVAWMLKLGKPCFFLGSKSDFAELKYEMLSHHLSRITKLRHVTETQLATALLRQPGPLQADR